MKLHRSNSFATKARGHKEKIFLINFGAFASLWLIEFRQSFIMKELRFSKRPIASTDEGLTLIEVAVALLILSIAITPLMGSFRAALTTAGSEERQAVFTNQARGTLYRIAALDFADLNGNQGNPVDLAVLFGSATEPKPAEAAKEEFVFQGITYTPQLAISDASGGVGGLLELSVTVAEINLKTLKADY
jgi:prepilin-type N-terminal cleavage/methylation domain-containing protein